MTLEERVEHVVRYIWPMAGVQVQREKLLEQFQEAVAQEREDCAKLADSAAWTNAHLRLAADIRGRGA